MGPPAPSTRSATKSSGYRARTGRRPATIGRRVAGTDKTIQDDGVCNRHEYRLLSSISAVARRYREIPIQSAYRNQLFAAGGPARLDDLCAAHQLVYLAKPNRNSNSGEAAAWVHWLVFPNGKEGD